MATWSQVIERVRTGGLATAFLSHKGRFYSFLKTIPLYVIMDDKVRPNPTLLYLRTCKQPQRLIRLPVQVGLLGSKVFGIQLLKKQLAEQS
jgi:hypothetical protein